MVDSKIWRAVTFAVKAHQYQDRKYTGEPYVVHPLRVAGILSDHDASVNMVIAGLLHDVLEDTTATPSQINDLFGPTVLALVEGVTDVALSTDGNRRTRNAKNDAHLAAGNSDVQTIKCADILANVEGNRDMPGNFGLQYLYEKRQTLALLQKARTGVWAKASLAVNNAIREREGNEDRGG